MVDSCHYFRFQSAPLAEARGDEVLPAPFFPVISFQSAPLAEARGDKIGSVEMIGHVMFQSAPLAEARGDKTFAHRSGVISGVSIRSPCRSKGRSSMLA